MSCRVWYPNYTFTFIKNVRLKEIIEILIKAKANLDVFTEIVAEMESDKNPQAKNPKSTAAGLFQYTKPSLVTAKQRYKNIADRVGIEDIPDSIEKAKDAR